MTGPERVRAELDILGLDASAPRRRLLRADARRARGHPVGRDLLGQRSRADVLVAGVKVATQTPPIRSGRRVVFLTLDDATGPVDATFFEDVQGPYAATVFHSWMLLVRGVVRRTGPRGVSLRATGAWELSGAVGRVDRAAASRPCTPRWPRPTSVPRARCGERGLPRTPVRRPGAAATGQAPAAPSGCPGPGDDPTTGAQAGGMGGAGRVLVHASGFKQSPYADIKPAGRRRQGPARAPGEGRAVPDPTGPGRLRHRAAQALARQPGQLGALG